MPNVPISSCSPQQLGYIFGITFGDGSCGLEEAGGAKCCHSSQKDAVLSPTILRGGGRIFNFQNPEFFESPQKPANEGNAQPVLHRPDIIDATSHTGCVQRCCTMVREEVQDDTVRKRPAGISLSLIIQQLTERQNEKKPLFLWPSYKLCLHRPNNKSSSIQPCFLYNKNIIFHRQ